MKKENTITKIFAYISLTSGSIWLGAYISRLLTTYQMFEATELKLKSYITDSNISSIFQTTYPLVNLSIFSYLIMIFSFTIFLTLTKIKLKENGWLFIITMIIYITLPFEIILLLIDYKLFIIFMNEQFTSELILQLVTERITMLSSFPIILLLSYLSIPYFLIFKPYTKNT
ncbi:MAG: hypothetical protein H6Q27_1384 [Ignavibacteriaceae bacterium]|nr:hypothetical protein [Ignavibacteriaceae bacterium]